jgi:hypothetical protein
MKNGKYILIIIVLTLSVFTLKAGNNSTADNKDEAKVVVYPNPVSTDHVLLSSEKEIVKIELLNIIGQQLIFQVINPSSNLRLELGNLKNGIYLIKVTFTDETISTKRLWVE